MKLGAGILKDSDSPLCEDPELDRKHILLLPISQKAMAKCHIE
jgi:hypothetical protein